MTIKKIICTSILFILPIVLIIVFDPASMFSVRNFLSDVAGTIFFIDLPIAICLLHYYCPQLFKNPKTNTFYSTPWLLLFFGSWGVIALEMFISIKLDCGPENGFAAFCAYFFGWSYIWFTMIPIGISYLIFRQILKLCRKR